MKVIETIKKLMSEDYDKEQIPVYINAMCESMDSFRLGVVYVDHFDRISDEYKMITRYHREAIKKKPYKDMFGDIVEMAGEIGNAEFFKDEILGEEILEELKQNESCWVK